MEKFKEIYERWMDIWNGDLDLIGEVVSPAFVGHWPPAAVDAPFDVIGPARLREMVGMSRNLFPDLRVEVQVGPVTEGDTMAARWVGRGHYAGGIRGATAPRRGPRCASSGAISCASSRTGSWSTGSARTGFPSWLRWAPSPARVRNKI